jgi:WD40 repeat protein
MVTSSVDSIVRLWDESGTLTKALKDHRDMINVAKWNKEGNIIASAGYDSYIIVSLNSLPPVMGLRGKTAKDLQVD